MQTISTIGYVNPQEGDNVRGTYFGKPFTGIVTKLRFHTVTGYAMWYVDTDQTFLSLGEECNSVVIKLPDALECINGNSIEIVK